MILLLCLSPDHDSDRLVLTQIRLVAIVRLQGEEPPCHIPLATVNEADIRRFPCEGHYDILMVCPTDRLHLQRLQFLHD